MSGQPSSFPPAAFIETTRPIGSGWSLRRTPQIFIALTASCILHAGLILLPYLGQRSVASRPVVDGKSARNSDFAVRLSVIPKITSRNLSTGSGLASASIDMNAGKARDERVAQPSPDRPQGADLFPIPAPAFYTTDQLTKPPQPAEAPDLEPPQDLPIAQSGKMILKLWINARGEVVDITAENNELTEAVTAAVVANFRRTRFMPGERNGERVPSVMRIEIVYDGSPSP